MSLSAQLYETMHRDPELPIADFKGRTFTKGDYAALADRVVALLDEAGIEEGLSIGVIVRNRPLHAATMLGLIAGERWLTSIYAIQTPEAIAQELRESQFAAIIADAQDWTPPVLEAATACGSLGIALDHGQLDIVNAGSIDLVPGLDRCGDGPFRQVGGEPGIEVLSSGTTGKPKRIVFPTRMLVRAVESTRAAGGAGVEPEPDILCWPYGGIGGMCGLVASAMLDRYTSLLEKFSVPEWVEAVERLKPTIVTGMPAMARMILDAEVPKARIASLKYFYGGSAPMTPDLQAEFEATYGINVIWAYGATEFLGTVISWTPALHAEFRESKLGAMGRALPGVELRVTDGETGQPLPNGEEGFLEVRVHSLGEQWIRTTDIVAIDADGFVFHKGRGDGAILRGGHKVLPEKVVDALRTHPDVLDAAVVGLADDRLGQVPVAAVELKSGLAQAPGTEQVLEHARQRLTAPQVPARLLILPALPRTTSLKVDLRALAALFAQHG